MDTQAREFAHFSLSLPVYAIGRLGLAFLCFFVQSQAAAMTTNHVPDIIRNFALNDS